MDKRIMKKMSKGYDIIINTLINDMGYDTSIDRQNMKDSAERSAKGFLEIIKPIPEIKRELKNIVSKKFRSTFNGMVTIQNIIAFSFCPHHFLPVIYRVTMAYLPKDTKTHYVTGLSKPARVAIILAGRPVLQETLVMDIASVLARNYVSNPKFPGIDTDGCAVVVEGLHMCMACRGIKQHGSRAVMQKLYGAFMDSKNVKEEFMAIFQSNRPQTII